ncbi:MAG: hypothetical protein GY859_25480 [Desulfobacterales bacterium]|nr:hypothetical protein [Desulfobacterales bacterium]
MIRRAILLSIIFIQLTGLRSFAQTDIGISREERRLIEKGEVIVREAPCDKKTGRAFEAIGLVETNISELYRILVTFEEYPSFMPNLDKLDVLYQDASRATLNYTLGLPMGKVKKYRLSMRFERRDDGADLQWEMIDWPGVEPSESIHDTTGYWRLRSYPDKKGYVIAVYHVYTDPGPIPFGLGWIVDVLTKSSVPDVLINTRERVR